MLTVRIKWDNICKMLVCPRTPSSVLFSCSVVPARQLSPIQWWTAEWLIYWLYFSLPNRSVCLDLPKLSYGQWVGNPLHYPHPLPRPALHACDACKVQSGWWVLTRPSVHNASHTRLLFPEGTWTVIILKVPRILSEWYLDLRRWN